jgi:lipopolysaccharide export system protein LptA
MPRLALLALALALVLAGTPAPATSQQQGCNQVLPSDFRRVITQTGQEIMYFRDPVRMICPNGVQIEADSAVMNRSANSLEMVGQVLYRDGDRQLTADWGHYWARTDELFARGSVVLTDLADGSVIRGQEFEYQRETTERPESRMVMREGRPHAELRRAPAEGGEPGAPVQVWADRLELLGETVFAGQGNVELEREDLRGGGDAIRFDQGADRMTLTGNAHVETDDYRLDGDRIDAFMAGNALREVASDGRARLVGEDLTVRGRHIRIGFVDGDPERIEAWSPPPAAGGEGDRPAGGIERAVAISRDFRLRADSIDARSAAGQLREVHAVGRAYGEREADTLSVRLPDTISRDWIQGDTIIGYFAQAEETAEAVTPDADGEADTRPGLELERVEVIGGASDALSLYRREAAGGGANPAVNFTRARRITLFMTAGEVDRVEADGPLEGIYLDPVRGGAEAVENTRAAAPAARGRT